MYGLAQTVFTWEAKVSAVAEAAVDTADVAEFNWKYKVTPDRGDLITTTSPRDQCDKP